MAAPQASSRLELLQARFQQKQLQEKEQKLLQLYDQQQQRAYQVVQRGSAGSNGSNHGSSISQHTVTRTSTSSHATSTLQGGKVRQMFDERRQTTVKGIDRSYPLEPLENKPRKQTNGNGVQRNGNLTVNRQSVTVKRVARSDVNSNLNDGKPVVSYHEEVTRESFGPSGEQHTDDDEFGNENHVAQYSNGNHREETRVGEVLNEDTIQKNRMMAKLHLMEYDETLKHRVKNDLESVQFPDDYMVDVPDKLPKQSGTKKLSQAEARLERFKNANARRSNSIAKNSNTISVPKKRSDPAFPAKPTSSGNEAVKNRTRKVLQKELDTRKGSPQRGETLMSDSERNPRRRNESPKFFCKESEKSATTYAIDSTNSGRLSPDFSKDKGRRSASPKFFCKESEKSATTYAIDSKAAGRFSPDFSKDRGRRSASPKFFCKESEKSATTYAIDTKTAGKFSPDFSKGVKRTVVKIEPKGSTTTFTKLDQSVRKKSDKSAATISIDTVDRNVKSSRTSSPESIKNEMIIPQKVQEKINTKPIRSGSPNVFDRLTKERSASPRFLDRESEKAATKMHFTSKSPERTEKIVKKRSDSPSVVSRKREASSIHASKRKSPDSAKRILRKASTSPQFFLTDSNRSSTIMLVTPETITKPRTDSAKSKKKTRPPGPCMNKSNVTLSSRIAESSRRVPEEDIKESPKYNIRSSVSRFFSEQCERASRNEDAGTGGSIQSTATGRSSDMSGGSSPVSLKDMKTPGPANRTVHLSSPRSQKVIDSRNAPAEFFCYETERSATTVKPKSPRHSINERSKNPRTKSSHSSDVQSMGVKCKSSKTSDNFTVAKGAKITAGVGKSNSRGSSPGSMKAGDSRSGTPEFFCYESDKSATTVSFTPKSRKDSKGSKGPPSRPSSSTSVHPPGGSSKSPDSFNLPEDVEIIPNVRRNSSREPSPRSQKIVDTRSGTPEFFCYESEKSATTVSLKPKSTKDPTNNRPKSPPSRPTSSTSVQPPGRSSKSPDFSPPKDSKVAARRGSNNVLRSTRLIRDIINRQKGGSRSDYASGRVATESRGTAFESAEGSIEGAELKHGSKVDEAEELKANRSVDKRATTPRTPAYELLAPESTPKSSTRVDVGTQEITMHDQYIKQENIQRGQLRSTYSKSFGKATRDSKKKSSTENLFTYPVRKSSKKRASLFESSIFEPPKKDRQGTDPFFESRRARGSTREVEATGVGSKGNASSTERSCSSSPSPTNESFSRSLKRGLREKTAGQVNGAKALRSRRKTASPIFGESKKQRRSPTPHKQAQILRSIELVRRIVKGSQSERNEARREVCKTVASNVVVEKRETRNTSESEIEGKKSESVASATETISFASNDYERTDSVESALRRFDSIDTEAGVASVRSNSGRSKDRESMTEKRRAEAESWGVAGSVDDSRAISLKALDQVDVNVPPSSENKLSRGTLKKASTASETVCASVGASLGASKNQEPRGRKKLAKARDSIEIARITARSKSPACRRKLFPDVGATEGTKTGVTRSGCSLESMKTTEHLSSRKKGRKSETVDSARAATRFVKHVKQSDKRKEGKASTGASGSDRSVLVKRLRSIEDIRKSIGSESCRRGAAGASASLKSAIASDASRCSSPVQRRASSEDRVGNRKGLSLSKRSESLSGRREASGDSEGSVKCATRSFRVAKSPSPDSTKATEMSGRPRRNVPSSPSKSPDTVTRRPSTDFKVQDTKPSKRPVPMKGTEPIGNRKTATTSTTTSTRKSTDVVDGAILENGLHLRDQTAETKYDNDSPTTKKSDAFVIEFDEQPSKENDGPPRKPLLRKQSTEKQTPPAQSGRPPSSVSSTSNSSSMQASVSRGKMASRARTPISGTASSKGSASSKGGTGSCAADSLVPCKMCGRRFAHDRVGLHEQICAKTGQKKRKQFDAMMYRVKGTELEPFLRRATCKKPEKSKKPEVKTNWRRKHEDFINTIRSAKQVQAHLAAGGKLSDLPPPPVSDTSDYIQCPHCGRKFNQCAAERHIPKCEHMLHNKPVHLRAPKPRR